MSDWKEKIPDLDEVAAIAKKFANDVSKSVGEIVDDYKSKRATELVQPTEQPNVTPDSVSDNKSPSK